MAPNLRRSRARPADSAGSASPRPDLLKSGANSDDNAFESRPYAAVDEDDRAGRSTRLRVFLGLSILSWLVLGLIGVGLATVFGLL